MALVLFREKDKKNKLKENQKNLINYLNVKDLWNMHIYKDIKFNEDLSQLKNLKIRINNTIWFYDYLIEEEGDVDYIEEIKDYLKKKYRNLRTKKIKEKQYSESSDGLDEDFEEEEEEEEEEKEKVDSDY